MTDSVGHQCPYTIKGPSLHVVPLIEGPATKESIEAAFAKAARAMVNACGLDPNATAEDNAASRAFWAQRGLFPDNIWGYQVHVAMIARTEDPVSPEHRRIWNEIKNQQPVTEEPK